LSVVDAAAPAQLEFGLPLDPVQLLTRAFNAQNGAKLQALYGGDVDGYPSDSEADLALADLLAFWTGPDPEQIERLMRGSGRARDKWDQHRASTSPLEPRTATTEQLGSGMAVREVGRSGSLLRARSAPSASSGCGPIASR
jgi:hypothetical protein